MQLKRITAPDARTATRLASARYGSDALIVSNEKINGKVEVIVAVEEDRGDRRPAADGSLADTASGAEAGFGAVLASLTGARPAEPADPVASESARARELVSLLRDEFAELRREFQLQQKLAMWQSAASLTPLARAWDEALAAAAAPAALRALLIGQLGQASDRESSLEMARSLLSARCPAQAAPHSLEGIHLLAGPTGSGKSVMIARLARAHAASRGFGPDQVALISLGDRRPGAWSQIQLLGAQAGVDCYRAADVTAVAELLDELGGRRLVLIDTPGAGGWEMALSLKNRLPRLVCHLVVPADISVAALKRLTGGPVPEWNSLMVSKLDEASHAWGLIQAGTESSLGISFAGAEPRGSVTFAGDVGEHLARTTVGNLMLPEEPGFEDEPPSRITNLKK